jgi:anti-sigma-K factor RskA
VDTTGNHRLRELLAAEYALGTLKGGARRRFERWMRQDAGLRSLAYAWSDRLRPMLDGVAPVAPPARVWTAIELRVFGTQRPGTAGVVPWWERLGLWRGLAAAFAVLAAVGLGLATRPRTVEGPTIVRVEPAPKVTPAEPKIVEVDRVPDAIATLVDPKTSKPVAVVWEARDRRAVYVKVAADVEVGDQRALQLWVVPGGSKDLISAGMLPPDAKDHPVRVDETTPAVTDASALSGATAFGLSLEPPGGSPKATKVLGLGPVLRLTN